MADVKTLNGITATSLKTVIGVAIASAKTWNGVNFTGSSGPPYHRSITIDRSLCGSANSTDFTMLFSGTYTFLKTTLNGGEVENASGYDVWFTSDAAGTTLLSWETVKWDGATGEVEYWIKIPTLNSTAVGSDTVIYIWTGDASIVTYQGGATGAAYDANFVGVWHYPDGTTLSLLDSTTNGNDGTQVGTMSAVTGKIDGAASTGYPTAGYQNNGVSYSPTMSMATPTVSCWIKLDSTTGYQAITTSGAANGIWMNAGKMDYYTTSDHNATTSVGTGAWVHVAMTHDASNIRFYYNGATDGVIPLAGFTMNVNNSFKDSPSSNTLRGALDELRISSSVRSASWILSEYNNQNNPSAFYSVSGPL